jgi:cell division initiation protein
MIDLTPLDVRKKKGDFARALRGYDPQEVDQFLDLVSERLEGLVKANMDLEERTTRLARQVEGSEGREKAVQEALITAQELREEIRDQARREADLLLREAESEAQEIRKAAEEEARTTLEGLERTLEERHQEIRELTRARERFLRAFRHLLEREMDALEQEEGQDVEASLGTELPAASARGTPAAGEGTSRTEDRDAPVSVNDPDHNP